MSFLWLTLRKLSPLCDVAFLWAAMTGTGCVQVVTPLSRQLWPDFDKGSKHGLKLDWFD